VRQWFAVLAGVQQLERAGFLFGAVWLSPAFPSRPGDSQEMRAA